MIPLLLALAHPAALAADEAEPPPEVRLVIRGIAEHWSDTAIGTVYRSGGFEAGLGVVVPVFVVDLDIEVAYKRLTAESGDELRLQMVPISALVAYAFGERAVQPYAGIGPTWTVFWEKHGADEQTGIAVTRGAKVGLEARVGVRIDTGLVLSDPLPPAQPGPLRGVEIDVYLGRRSQLPNPDGFDLGAWRGSAGLSLVF